MTISDNKQTFERIAEALERISPAPVKEFNLDLAEGFVFDASNQFLKPVVKINRIPINLLKGLENQKSILLENTKNFSNGYPSNNALLWGAKGTGKSSLVKSVHAEINRKNQNKELKLIEIHREDIIHLPNLLTILSKFNSFKFVVIFQ